jgi:hypothetical protein
MITWFTADRIKNSTLSYTVMVRASGTGPVDVSFWLNDAEARELGRALLAASEPTVPATATPEAA